MGDLHVQAESPSGTEVTLFDGANCAGEDGINVEFDDRARESDRLPRLAERRQFQAGQ